MGKKIDVEVERVDLENENTGRQQPGVRATCTECDHTTESFGTGKGSVNRCLALMREQCPEGADAFYVADDKGD